MDELVEWMGMFERLENNMSELDWALQFAIVIGRFVTLMQENFINQEDDSATSEFRELMAVTVNNLEEAVNRYVLMAITAETERMIAAQRDN